MSLKDLKINSFKNYGLCPSHYLCAPGLSWYVMLKMTKIELELLPDPDMYILFEKGTRGRISSICNRYSKADNKYLNLVTQNKNQNILYT